MNDELIYFNDIFFAINEFKFNVELFIPLQYELVGVIGSDFIDPGVAGVVSPPFSLLFFVKVLSKNKKSNEPYDHRK